MQWKHKNKPNPNAIALVQACSGAGYGQFSISPPPSSPSGWLATNSWFRTNGLEWGKKSLASFPTSSEIADYTAISKTIHYWDAWGFFSAAVQSLSSHRYRQSIHFAYYGALHASMSILASAGIGVWNRLHTALDDQGQVTYIENTGTHEFSWQALSHWMRSRKNTESILKELKVDWVSTVDLVSELGGGSSRGLFEQWFNVWASDLKTWELDRSLRNDASYRPSLMKTDKSLSDKEVTSFLEQIWMLLRPVGSNNFGQLDALLLHLTLKDVRDNLGITMNDMTRRISKASNNLGLTNVDAQIITAGFGEEVLTPNSIFLHAIDTSRPVDDPMSTFSVISRTLFLIRVAAASHSPSRQGTNLNSWAKEKSEQLGLIEDAADLLSLEDLWEDISIVLEDLLTKEHDQTSAEIAYRRQRLTEFERAALWTLDV